MSCTYCGCDPEAKHMCARHLAEQHQPLTPLDHPSIRIFETGATRDMDTSKPDYEGYLSPLVIHRFGEFMTKNRLQKDGNLRDSDNWQKGIPLSAYMKSGWRHFVEWWMAHRSSNSKDSNLALEESLCALIFNAQGYLHEILKSKYGVK